MWVISGEVCVSVTQVSNIGPSRPCYINQIYTLKFRDALWFESDPFFRYVYFRDLRFRGKKRLAIKTTASGLPFVCDLHGFRAPFCVMVELTIVVELSWKTRYLQNVLCLLMVKLILSFFFANDTSCHVVIHKSVKRRLLTTYCCMCI